jgi:hypothetical protein
MFQRNLVPLGGCIALVSFGFAIVQVLGTLALNGGSFETGSDAGSQIGTFFSLFASLASVSFVSGVNGYAAQLELRGEKPTFSGAWNTGWRCFLPQLGITILLWLMLIIGWTLFLIPGMIVGVLFGMAPAAQVVERKGVFAAFGDSFRASEDRRLALFGYYAVSYILFIVAVVVLYFLLAALSIGSIMGTAAAQSSGPPTALIIVLIVIAIPLYIFLLGAIPLALGSITSAAYATLRRDRSNESLSRVFD